MTIGERILNRRESLNKKQYEIAEAIGVTKATMCKYERGQNLPNAEIVARLAAALETSADYLCGVTEDPARLAVGRTKPADEDLRLFREFLLLSRENKLRVSERIKTLLEAQEQGKQR